MSSHVLVVDDEAPVRHVLQRLLDSEGFHVSEAVSAQEALIKVREKPDVMILDLQLPDGRGEQVCAAIRQDDQVRSVPILVISGYGAAASCLNGGADDYLAKPFELDELLARVRALMRRPAQFVPDAGVLTRGDVTIHIDERRVVFKGRTMPGLSPKEFHVFKQLILHTPRVVDKNSLALTVWGVPLERLHSRTLDVHVRRIRKKFRLPGRSRLKTVPAVGYQWV